MMDDPNNPGLAFMQAAGEGAGRESVNKISNALGAAAPFWGMKKRAADVYIKAIENGDYTPDEKYLLIAGAKKHCKELENQMAIAEIAQQYAKEGTDFSMASDVSDEFVSRIMDAGKHVSDEEAQLLWGNVLAGEFETPGSTPWSVIRILSELTKNYAEIFSKLCSLQFDVLVDQGSAAYILGSHLFIGEISDCPYLSDFGISFVSLQELVRLGLVNFDSTAHYVKVFSPSEYQQIHLISGEHVISISKLKDDQLFVGHVSLTEPGDCISKFIPRVPNPAHIQAAKDYLKKQGIECAEAPTIKITEVRAEKARQEYRFLRL